MDDKEFIDKETWTGTEASPFVADQMRLVTKRIKVDDLQGFLGLLHEEICWFLSMVVPKAV
jgi:hypothetical protein